MDQREVIKKVIKDAVEQADQKASEVYEQQTLPDYLNYRGEEYRDKILECVYDVGFSYDDLSYLEEMGYLPHFYVMDFSQTYMNKPWEDLTEEERDFVEQRDYGQGLNEQQRATLMRYFYVLDALRNPYDYHGFYSDGSPVMFSESFEDRIDMFAQLKLERPYDFRGDNLDDWKAQLSASAPKILDFVMAIEDEAFEDVMRYNSKAN